MKLGSNSYHTEINSRCIQDLNVTVKHETSRRQQENIFMTLGQTTISYTKHKTKRGKNDKFDFIKIKASIDQKYNLKKIIRLQKIHN